VHHIGFYYKKGFDHLKRIPFSDCIQHSFLWK